MEESVVTNLLIRNNGYENFSLFGTQKISGIPRYIFFLNL